jgi:hypothetical protein
VLTAVVENTPVAVEVLPIQANEASHVEKMIDATAARLPQIQEATADKGFDGEPQRRVFETRNIKPVTRLGRVRTTGPVTGAFDTPYIKSVISYRIYRRNRCRLRRKAYAERNKIE